MANPTIQSTQPYSALINISIHDVMDYLFQDLPTLLPDLPEASYESWLAALNNHFPMESGNLIPLLCHNMDGIMQQLSVIAQNHHVYAPMLDMVTVHQSPECQLHLICKVWDDIRKVQHQSRHAFSVMRVVNHYKARGTFVHFVFRRGELVKLPARGKIYQQGSIEGISHANAQAKVNGQWYDFAYIYKMDYDELGEIKAHFEGLLTDAEYLAGQGHDGTGCAQLAAEVVKEHHLTGYQERISSVLQQSLKKKVMIRQRHEQSWLAHQEHQRQQAERARQAAAAKPQSIEMTMAEWKKEHRDFKGIKDGQRSVLREGRQVSVVIVKPVK